MFWAMGQTIPINSKGPLIHACIYGKVRDFSPTVAEPPELYGPHAPDIVLKTSDYCT